MLLPWTRTSKSYYSWSHPHAATNAAAAMRAVGLFRGSKALRAAVTAVFGRAALVQRCQIHKTRNILDHLPERQRRRRRLMDDWAAYHDGERGQVIPMRR